MSAVAHTVEHVERSEEGIFAALGFCDRLARIPPHFAVRLHTLIVSTIAR